MLHVPLQGGRGVKNFQNHLYVINEVVSQCKFPLIINMRNYAEQFCELFLQKIEVLIIYFVSSWKR